MINKFLPQKSLKNIWIFFFAFSAFLILGLWLIFGDYSVGVVTKGVSRLNMGLVVTGFCVFALAFISWRAFSNRPLYIIDEDSLTIKPFGIFASPKVFDLSQIENAEKISATEVVDLTTRLMRDIEWEKWTLRLPSMARDQVKFLKLIQYCSLPITIEKISVGGKNIQISVYLKTQTGGEFILLSLKDGERYLISPIKVDEFISLLQSK